MADVLAPGAPDINITKIMQGFGYTPTEAEAQALTGAFGADNDATSKAIGVSAIAQYVTHKQAELERQKNDPLTALQTRLEEEITLQMNQVQGLQGQLQDTLSAAPELFGSLTPDQIQTYLAPLKTSFDQQLSQVQGVMASRGLGASSTEANALAQTGKQFQEQVFSAGLGVGLQSQQNKATAIQEQIKNLFGLTGQEQGIVGAAAGQRSAQDLGQSNLIASLPYFLDQSALQQDLIQKQLSSGGGFWDTFNKVTSGINQGVNAFQSLAMIPQQFKTASPGGGGGGGTPFAMPSGPNVPGQPAAYSPPPPLFNAA